ncbi:hypothetical protein [Ignatzschineria rhizosphaerae]|nr:hypothetical protein [Ignatzschineria rhizosphaerae]
MITTIAVLIITACSSTEIRDFVRRPDPTGIAKVATRASVDEEM